MGHDRSLNCHNRWLDLLHAASDSIRLYLPNHLNKMLYFIIGYSYERQGVAPAFLLWAPLTPRTYQQSTKVLFTFAPPYSV